MNAGKIFSSYNKKISATVRQIVVFFVGDQLPDSLPLEMLNYQDPQYQLDLLQRKFPLHSHFLLVFPEAITETGFSVYRQFLHHCLPTGEPEKGYVPSGFKALRGLQDLLKEHVEPSPTTNKDNNGNTSATHDAEELSNRIDLVGFSKGGVVLNQILAELSLQAPTSQTIGVSPSMEEKLLQRWALTTIQGVHYIDVGLNTSGAYLTDIKQLQQLGENVRQVEKETAVDEGEQSSCEKLSSSFKVTMHGTWRQWGDAMRPWIDEERLKMAFFLQRAKIPLAMIKFERSELPLPGPWRNVGGGKGSVEALVGLLAHMQCLELFNPNVELLPDHISQFTSAEQPHVNSQFEKEGSKEKKF